MYDQEELLENLLDTLANVIIDYEEMSGKTCGLEFYLEGKHYLFDGEKIELVKSKS